MRRKPRDQCAWSSSTPTLPLVWSNDMAYLVGLIATDGCLLARRKRISFVSKDQELVEIYRHILRRTNTISAMRTRTGGTAYRMQFGDVELYEWLIRAGLSPRKSLTLGSIAVPDEFLLPLARGLLDGDGTIINKTYRADTRDRPDYRWEYLQVRFVSASLPHLQWLDSSLARIAHVSGYVHKNGITTAGNAMFELRYGKHASLDLLPQLYADADAPCLSRKRAIWAAYKDAHAIE